MLNYAPAHEAQIQYAQTATSEHSLETFMKIGDDSYSAYVSIAPCPTLSSAFYCTITSLSDIGVVQHSQGYAFNDTENYTVKRYSQVLAKITNYTSLSEGWDGDAAVPPRLDVGADVEQFLNGLGANIVEPKTMLGSDGEVGLYWRSKNAYAEIGFDRDHGNYFFIRGGQIDSIHLDDISLDNQEVREALNRNFSV